MRSILAFLGWACAVMFARRAAGKTSAHTDTYRSSQRSSNRCQGIAGTLRVLSAR
jgi:hypothetical protein